MALLLPVLVFFPMLAGPVCWCIGRRSERARDLFAAGVTLAEAVLMLPVLLGGELSCSLPGVCGLGLGFLSGAFRSLMGLLTACGWFAATLLSWEYFAHQKRRNRYYMFWLITLGATMGIFLSADLYTTFVFFEVMSFTSFVAVIHTQEEDALQAAGTYLAVAVIGGLVTLSGLFLLYHQLGTLEIAAMAGAASGADRTRLWVGGLLTLVGFAAKAGAFPLHIWLPTAHPAAPAPASAVLSGVITKSGIYGVAVLSTTIFLHDGTWGLMLAAIGAITMVLGAVLAVFSIDLKRTFACSSVSQIGFVLVGVAMQCLLGEHNALAVDGTILHILNHSLIKMVLFPAAGIIHLSTHSYDLDDIRGFGRGKPLLMVLMGIPMFSLAGVPLLNGYVSKTLLHESIVEYIEMAGALEGAFHALEWLFLLAGGLTLAYMLKLFVCIFVEKPLETGHRHPDKSPYIEPVSAAALGAYVAVMPVLGVLPNLTMDNIAAFARGFFHGHAPGHAVHYFSLTNLKGAAISLIIGTAVYLLLVRPLLRSREGRYVDRWPRWLNLEKAAYRPLLEGLLPGIGTAVASVPDRLVNWAAEHLPGIGSAVASVPDRLVDWAAEKLPTIGTLLAMIPDFLPDFLVNGISASLLEALFWGQSATAEPELNHHFGRYDDAPHMPRGFTASFSFGLMLMGVGLMAAILYIFLL